jgi:hypothetical protein
MVNIAKRVARLRNLMAKAKNARNHDERGLLLDKANRMVERLYKATHPR